MLRAWPQLIAKVEGRDCATAAVVRTVKVRVNAKAFIINTRNP
jgi:hypothetical protein